MDPRSAWHGIALRRASRRVDVHDLPQEIRWVQRDGKNHALDADGANHWRHCAGRRRAAKRVMTFSSPWIRGDLYRPSCGECGVPPWELCACSALLTAQQAEGRPDGPQ